MAAETHENLLHRYRELQQRLEEAEEIIQALRSGEVDAVVVDGSQGQTVYTLKGADHAYRAMVESMAEGALTLSLDGLILFSNDQFAALAGITLERIVGSRLEELIVAEDREILTALLAGRQRRKAEMRLKRDGGPAVPVYVSAENLVLEDIDCLCVIVTDLSEQKRNEEIVAAEKLARSILEQASEAILVVDAKGAITRASRAAARLAGKAVIPRQFDEVFPIQLGTGERCSFEDILAAVRQKRSLNLEGATLRRDGRTAELLLSVAPLRATDRALLGCVITLIDITDRTIKERQLRFQAGILENMGEAVVAADSHQRVTFWNAAAERLYGVPREKAIGRPLAKLYQQRWLWPEDERLAQQKLQQHGLWCGENEHVLPNGARLPVTSMISRISPEQGGGTFAVIRDMSQQKQAEAAAQESELRFQTLADSIPQLAWMADAQGWLFWYNRRWYDYTGTSPEEMEGWGWSKVHHPDHLERVTARWKQHLAAGENWEDTFPLRGKDGQYRWFLSRATPIRNAQGEIIRWFGTNTDITDRRQAEEALRESEARWRRLYEADIIGVAAADRDKVFEANDVFLEMVGCTREDLEAGGIRWRELTAPEYLPVQEHAIQALATHGSWQPFEKEYIRKDGSRIPVLIGAILLQPSPLTWVCFILDLTERRMLEKQLFEKQKLESIGLLAGGVAHDFNNLLVGILGNASLAQDMLPAGSPVRPILRAVIQASERAAHLTRQMLAYSGKGQFIIRPVNLSALAREVTSLVQSSISNRITVHLDLDANLPFVEADEGQLQQVIMNLVINAADAIGEHAGLITVRTAAADMDEAFLRNLAGGLELEPGLYVCLEVHDTGCGMDEATRQRIFDPFFTTKFTGRGLGLAAVSGIVRGHHGAIKVSSVPGKGSTFAVLFPAAVAPELPAETRDVPATERAGEGTVLVVDDEPVVLQTAKGALERWGYAVLEALNGREAIDILSRERDRVSLVLLDLSLPGMSGQEILPELRKIKPHLPVLVSSGYSEAEALRLFSGQEISGFIQKPYSASELADKVKSVSRQCDRLVNGNI